MSDIVNPVQPVLEDPVQTGANKGIKETMDVLLFLESVITAYEGAKKDGKFDINDLAHITPVIITALEAFKGSEQIIDELKEIDTAEATQLFQKVFELCQRLIKALTQREVAVPVMFMSPE